MTHFSTLAALTGLLALAGAARGQAAPTFVWAATLGAGSLDKPRGLVVADVNGDGLPDLLTANFNANTAGVLLGTGTGTFGAVTQFSTGTRSGPFNLKVADVNGDGKLDLLTANYTSSTVGVLLGTGTGSFGPVTTFGAGGSTPFNLVVADVNADGKPDVVTANLLGNNVGVLLGTGTGSFGPANAFGAGNSPNDIAVGDVNGDAKLDIVVSNQGNTSASVLLGTGAGSFGAAATISTGPSNYPEGLAVADVNADGKLDILTANNPYTVGVLLGTGTGTFGTAAAFSTSSGTRAVVVADVNGDSKPDLLTANITSSTVSVLSGTGMGSFAGASAFGTGTNSGPIALAAADVNGDGKPDLLTANYGSSTISVLLNTTPLPTRATLPGATATLAPNPANEATALTIKGLAAAITQVQATLLDATGREVVRQVLPVSQSAARAELPTTGLAPGLYVVRLLGCNGQGVLVGELPAQRLSVQ